MTAAPARAGHAGKERRVRRLLPRYLGLDRLPRHVRRDPAGAPRTFRPPVPRLAVIIIIVLALITPTATVNTVGPCVRVARTRVQAGAASGKQYELRTSGECATAVVSRWAAV